MGPLQRKIVAFLFLLMVAVPLCLSLKFILGETRMQLEAEERMETETLQSLSIAKTDIVWVRPGKEILLGGELFDVKYTLITNDSVLLTGYFDTEETELVTGLKKYTERKSNDNALNKATLNFLFPPVFNNGNHMVYERDWFIISSPYAFFAETLPASPCLPFIRPPQLHAGLAA